MKRTMIEVIKAHASDFPNLSAALDQVTSPQDPFYNCIAWAAGETHRWWWPGFFSYWPAGVPRTPTLRSFEAAFATMGYQKCACQDFTATAHEREHVAIYANGQEPTHGSRQLADGSWTSKLGQAEDVCHKDLSGVAGGAYGAVVLILCRER